MLIIPPASLVRGDERFSGRLEGNRLSFGGVCCRGLVCRFLFALFKGVNTCLYLEPVNGSNVSGLRKR
jgi:hypothetical protein